MSRTSILFGLFMLSIAFVVSSPLSLDATMILRQHYGVVFKPRQTVRPTTGLDCTDELRLTYPLYQPVIWLRQQLVSTELAVWTYYSTLH